MLGRNDSLSPPQSSSVPGPRTWLVRGRAVELATTPCLMGIVNITPDSFSDGGRFLEPGPAVDQALRLVGEGAEIIDVGGESTRPGAQPVADDEELRRITPVVEQLARQSSVVISVDTTKSAVARAALDAGAHIVNDISGLKFDPLMPEVCAASGAGVICMHIRGTPETMQIDPQYDDVVEEICRYLEERLADLELRGIVRERLAIDPGVGFGKTARHNLEILGNVERFRKLGRPVCIGHSRKRFLQKLLGRPVDERLFATVGVSVALALQGAEIIRVHDVAATRDAILACRAILDASRPGAAS
ncbi:MAG TPA: dihydropteroate synthase [Planctomycetaceae bacterium]|nr:dihydropteroate synthase [Planctomycetaceae bacterium]